MAKHKGAALNPEPSDDQEGGDEKQPAERAIVHKPDRPIVELDQPHDSAPGSPFDTPSIDQDVSF